MKCFKNIFCALLCCLLVVVTFSACGKKDSTPNSDKENNQIPKMSATAKIINEAYLKLDAETKVEYGEAPSFSFKNQSGEYEYEAYDEFVYGAIFNLKAISETENLKEETWLQGEQISGGASGKANKLEMLYVENKVTNLQNNIKIYMYFTKNGYDFAENPKSFVIFAYDINYNSGSKEMSVTCQFEDSTDSKYNGINNGSEAKYSVLSYDSQTRLLQVSSFSRLQEFDYSEPELIYAHIRDYKSISFFCNVNQPVNNDNPSLSDINVQKGIQNILNKFNETEEVIFNLEKEKISVSGLTNKFIKFALAEHISDFD